jgi:hypothetical protein
MGCYLCFMEMINAKQLWPIVEHVGDGDSCQCQLLLAIQTCTIENKVTWMVDVCEIGWGIWCLESF